MNMQGSGQEVEIKPREIEIYSIEFLDISIENQEITYKVKCSKGTYIRSLCEDIAERLGTVGYMKELRRTIVGDFKIENTIKISEINDDIFKENFITVESFFKSKEKIILNQYELKKFLNGVKIKKDVVDDLYRIYDNDLKFIGIGVGLNKTLKRDICV